MKIKELTLSTKGFGQMIDLTEHAADFLRDHELQQGHLNIFVPGSTGALTTIEYESGALEDLGEALERIAPQDLHYKHDARWGDGNGFSHVRAALMGPSLTIPFINGDLVLGTWQQIILLDFDNHPRQRRLIFSTTN